MSEEDLFYTWLMKQKFRCSPVGDLARDAAADTSACLPRQSNDWEDWEDYLSGTAAEEALENAWEEWSGGDREGSPFTLQKHMEIGRLLDTLQDQLNDLQFEVPMHYPWSRRLTKWTRGAHYCILHLRSLLESEMFRENADIGSKFNNPFYVYYGGEYRAELKEEETK